MLAFVDESGDTGLKLRQGSSAFFLIAVVIFEDHAEADKADRSIADLRRQLDLAEDFEFHFSKCSCRVRTEFFKAVAQHDFFYLGFGLQKSDLFAGAMPDAASFYRWVCGTVFENCKPYLDNTIVRLDKCGDQDFRHQLSAYLTKRINDNESAVKHIKSVRAEDSRKNNLLQLADMVCGAVNRSLQGEKADSGEYRKIIKHRELSMRMWPDND